jgi:hypothetical protein
VITHDQIQNLKIRIDQRAVNIILVLLILLSALMNFLLLSYAFENKERVIFFEHGLQGIKVVDQKDDELILQSFLRDFVIKSSNYSYRNYKDRIQVAGDLLSVDEWNRLKRRLLSEAERVSARRIRQTGDLIEIEKIEDGLYGLKIQINRIDQNSKPTESTRVVKVRVNTALRTKSNPWGYEIDQIYY